MTRKARMKTTSHFCCLVVSFLVAGPLLECGVGAFNLDPYSITVVRPLSTASGPLSNPTRDYFGYSHALLQENNTSWLMVGAPKANNSLEPGISEPGTVYKCRLADNATKNNMCTELRMDFESGKQPGYTAYKYNQWLGGAMDVSSSTGEFVACGHRQTFSYDGSADKIYMSGVCFSRKDTTENASLKRNRNPTHGGHYTVGAWNPETKTYDKWIYRYPFASWGISVSLSTEGHVVMGGPGTWQWQGGLLVNFGSNITCSMENVTLSDSYFGYSVTSIRRSANDPKANKSYLFAGGAPRYNESGAVYILETTIPPFNPPNDNIGCKFSTVQEIKSQHYGSYFGAAILAEDTNADGWAELFVGAPFENRTYGDDGAVHYYVFNRSTNKFVESKVLIGSTESKGDTRFGTAIASIGDLNSDGFNDVIIGSPFEDTGRGAIYIFNGSPSGIEDRYSQRIAASNLQELSSIKSFGYSLSTGRDIDGNRYPDVSIGAYQSESVAIIRARPVHTVSAEIWFLEPVISWQRPNCSKTSDDQSFEMTLIISFFYTIPEQEKQNIKNTYVLVDYQNRLASLGPNQTIIFTDGHSLGHPIQFLVVPCLSGSNGNSRCVSFLVADRHATYMRLFGRNFYLDSMLTAQRSDNYKYEASFRLSAEMAYDKVMNMSCLAMQNQPLVVTEENGYLTTKQLATGDQHNGTHFRFTRGRYLPSIKDLSYELSIEGDSDSVRRGYLKHSDGSGASVKESIDFTVGNLEQPLNRTWKIVFPRYPKNIATPMKFKVNISGPSFSNVSRTSLSNASIDRIVFDGLLPVLSRHSKKIFTGEIGFKKECGDDDVCHPDLSVNMTLTKGVHSRGLVIGSLTELELRFYVKNTGEAAYSVRLEVIHPSVLPYSRVDAEDQCNQVSGTKFQTSLEESSANASTMQGLHCDVENQIHTNGSVAFKVYLDTLSFREESDFPKDFVELQCRVGTHGHIRNGTEIQPFLIPIRYEAQLDAFGKTAKNEEIWFNIRAAESKKSSERTLTFTHEYDITNKGPGAMPSVIVDVLLPDDSIQNITKITDVTVTVKNLLHAKRDVNGTLISETPVSTTTANPAENGTQPSTKAGHNDGSRTAWNCQPSTFGVDKKEICFMNCSTGHCSIIRRYNIGSMYVGDTAVVTITVQISAVILSNIENLGRFYYTSSVRLSPYNLSENVTKWREGKVEIVTTNLQTSTIFRPRVEPTPTPIWLIIVGVGVGILHFVGLILILKKCGFFRRKQYEQLRSEKRESRMIEPVMLGDAEAEQQEASSQYDNELLREQMSLKSQSQYSAAGSYGNGANGDETKRSISTVDALHEKHPGIDFTAE